MSIFFKASSGNFTQSIGLLLIRFSLGFLFLFAGARKVLNLQDFISSVQGMGQMNDTLAFVLAFILPFMQMLFGGLLIIGLFTPIAAFFLACMSLSFIFVLGAGNSELPFSYNFVFFATSAALMFTGAGLISFDALIDRDKDSKVNITIEKDYTYPQTNPENKKDSKKPNESDAIYVDEKDIAKGEDVNG